MSASPPPEVDLNPFMAVPNCNAIDADSTVIPCDELHRKIIALRIYLSLIIVNFLFILLTTSYFIYRSLTAKWHLSTAQSISKLWQTYSLKKRGIFGTVLGAIGHLVFSSTVLLYQVFVSSYTCDIYLFGPMTGFYIWTYAIVWRAMRLHLMIRVNQLQQQFVIQTCSLDLEQSEEYIWFQKHKGRLSVSTKTHIFIFLSTLSLLGIVIILAETLGIRRHDYSRGRSACSFAYGNYVILGLVIFFFVVVVPFIFWYLRDDEDAHGIRREIWITLFVGVPCFIVFVIWQVLFESPTASRPAGTRGVFGPANWITIVTTANHVMTVVLPLFKRLSIHRRKKASFSQEITAVFLAAPSSPSSPADNCSFELTTECLENALRDPRKRQVLQAWAIKDFSVENILFYEKYLALEGKVQVTNKLFCTSDIGDLLGFYSTFIGDHAPLQVNISCAARSEIDAALGPLCNKVCSKATNGQEDPSSSGIPAFLQDQDTVDELHLKYDLLYNSHMSITVPKLIEETETCDLNKVESTDMSRVTLEIFEMARKEVFWDIFSGLFPKVVAASH